MKCLLISALLGAIAFVSNAYAALDFELTSDNRANWLNEDKFGMFIHWGAYAVPAGEYKGKDVKGVMGANGIETVKLANRVNHPESLEVIQNFKPDLLVSLAGNEIFKQPLFEAAKYGVIKTEISAFACTSRGQAQQGTQSQLGGGEFHVGDSVRLLG